MRVPETSLENGDEVPNSLLLVLSNAFRDPGHVSDFLIHVNVMIESLGD